MPLVNTHGLNQTIHKFDNCFYCYIWCCSCICCFAVCCLLMNGALSNLLTGMDNYVLMNDKTPFQQRRGRRQQQKTLGADNYISNMSIFKGIRNQCLKHVTASLCWYTYLDVLQC